MGNKKVLVSYGVDIDVGLLVSSTFLHILTGQF